MTQPIDSATPNRQFHGLFVGVNQYASADINNLASAVRDAAALHALFEDNLGDAGQLLTDEAATTARLRAELGALQTVSSEDDVVVVAFSGHGSDTHELITFDTDPYNLPTTALPLDELTELISGIPAKHLLVVLDCCFSGGAGAKVLTASLTPRGGPGGLPLSTTALLDRMAGTGRLILTASTADQPAWEDPRLGHGLLTHHLLQALLGPAEIAQDGRINLLDLLKYVTGAVKASASGTACARQEPTLRGRWDGDVIWPVFTPGSRYQVLHPATTVLPVTADVHSLRDHGIPKPVLDRWAANLVGLNQLQQDAVNQTGLMRGRNVLVMAPTSSGKTMIGELAALRATQQGGRSVFLLPTKALVNEQRDKFALTYGPAGVRTIRATGDYTDQVAPLLRGQFDIAVLTYEMFTSLALANPHLLRIISVVVIDEVQTVVDSDRGPVLELLLTLMKSRKEVGVAPQLIALSAVLGDLGGLDSWLDADLLRRTERPVPLEEGVLDLTGQYRYLDPNGVEQAVQLIPAPYGESRARTVLVPLVRKLVADGQQVLIIRGIRGDTRGAATYLAQSLGLPPAKAALEALPTGDPSLVGDNLRQCLRGGVAFHISDLERDERRVIEAAFRAPDSTIRVMVATTTLAQGVNLPAETVVIPELNRRIGRYTFQPYTVASYKNIAGRAGRLGLTERGRAIVLAYGQADVTQIWTQYVQGNPEDVRSALLAPNADMYTLVLRVVAVASQQLSADTVLTQDDVLAVLANSLAAHQNRLTSGIDLFEPTKVAPVLASLRSAQFIKDDGSGLRLTPLGEVVAESGLAVRSATAVANVLRLLQPADLNRATLITTAQLTTELDATRLTVNTRGAGTETRTFVSQLIRQRTGQVVIDALAHSAPDQVTVAARAKKAVACLLWMQGMPSAQLEQVVMRHYHDRNAIGPVRAVAARTRDIIGVVIEMANMIHPTADLTRLATLLPVQLELGIPADLAPLAIAGADLTREHYLNLVEAGLNTPQLIDQADDDTLRKHLGGANQRLRTLRAAVKRQRENETVPSLADALPPPRD